MSIKVIEGKILCSRCNRLLDKREPFKINEFQYEIVCLECDIKYDFSKYNYVNCSTPMKQKLIDIIQNSMKLNKSITIDMENSRKDLIENLSSQKKKIRGWFN